MGDNVVVAVTITVVVAAVAEASIARLFQQKPRLPKSPYAFQPCTRTHTDKFSRHRSFYSHATLRALVVTVALLSFLS